MVDPRELRVARTIGVGAAATDLVVAHGQVWFAAGNDNKLILLDAHSGGVLETRLISRDLSAGAYAITAGAGAIWVASGDAIYKVATATRRSRASGASWGWGTASTTSLSMGAPSGS